LPQDARHHFRAEAEANAAAFDVRNKRGKLELHVRAQARQLRELELSQDVARLELKLAQQNQGVIQAQFDQGRATLSQLEQAQLDENDKWLAFLDAGFARQQAQLALLQTTARWRASSSEHSGLAASTAVRIPGI